MQYESHDTHIYARELGLNRNYKSASVAQGYPSYFPGVTVVDLDPKYMPDDRILGMTDLRFIWLRNDLGANRSEVLHHEHVHVRYPAASEYCVRQITRAERISRGQACRLH